MNLPSEERTILGKNGEKFICRNRKDISETKQETGTEGEFISRGKSEVYSPRRARESLAEGGKALAEVKNTISIAKWSEGIKFINQGRREVH